MDLRLTMTSISSRCCHACVTSSVLTHLFCLRCGIQSEDENELNIIKMRTFLQSEDKICVLALWYIAICTLPIGVIEEYKPYPGLVLYVLGIHICPHIECADAKIALTLIYLCTVFNTPFTLVSSL